MAYKDLTKQKGAYLIVAINPDPRLEGRIYVGYYDYQLWYAGYKQGYNDAW